MSKEQTADTSLIPATYDKVDFAEVKRQLDLNTILVKGGTKKNGAPTKRYFMQFKTDIADAIQARFEIPETVPDTQVGVILLRYAEAARVAGLAPVEKFE